MNLYSNLKKGIKIWVYSNLHIALIAFLISMESNYFLGIPSDYKSPLFVFFSTLFIYNLGYYKTVLFYEKAQRDQAEWLKKHMTYWVFSILVSLIFVLYLFYSFSIQAQVIISILSIISFIYVIHDFSIANKRFSIRNIPYAKTFIVSSIWAMITTLPQIIDHGLLSDYYSWLPLIAERFLFIFPITLMFDIRDLKSDPDDLHTIPKLIGIKLTKSWAILSLCIGFYFYYKITPSLEGVLMMAILYLLMIVSVLLSSDKRSEFFYSAYFDGMIGLHALIVIYQFI